MFKEKLRESLKGKINLKEICAQCQHPINLRKGSMTAWLYQETRCNCRTVAPQSPSAPHSPADESETDEGPNEQLVVDLGDAYEVLSKVGQGGMGAVYKVLDRSVGKTFAVKVLRADLARDRAAIKRFQQEVTAAKNLTHPNLAAVYGSGSSPDGTPYFIMDYLDGKTLADVVKEEGYLEPNVVLEMFVDITDALEHAHAKGVIHRDLKPSNIILSKREDGQYLPKIVDFGIATVMPADGATAARLTQTGEIFGSPAYMSPEQGKGERLDIRSDVYSIGCVMFETLTGKPPFAEDNPIKTILSHLNEIPKNLRKDFPKLDIPAGLATITQRCLEKDPDDRYQSMAELRRDLEAARDGKGLNKISISRKQAAKRLLRHSRLGVFIIVGLTLLVALPMLVISGYNNVLPLTTPPWMVQYHKGIEQLTMRNVGSSRSFLVKALQSAESGHAPDKDLELIYMGLGAVDCQIANYTHARPSLEHALTLNRRHAADLERAGVLELLSDCDVKSGNFKKAILEAGEALTAVRHLYGTNSQQTANALSHLEPSYRRDHQYAEAEKVNSEEIEINLKLHPDKQFQQLADAYSERANIKSAQNEPSEAIEAARNSLAINRDQQGKEGPTTQGVAMWLTKYLIDHNQKQEAARLAQEYNIKIDDTPTVSKTFSKPIESPDQQSDR